MKNILLILAFIFLAMNCQAQIILIGANYPTSVIGTDSLKETTYSSTFPSLAATMNGLWDMSVVIDSIPLFFAYRVAGKGNPFADSILFNLSTYNPLLNYNYQGNVQSSITGSSMSESGVNVQRIGYSISLITTGLSDSLFIDSQNINYSVPHTKIAFPATYPGSWGSAYSADLGMQLSIAAFSYSHAPGIIRRYTTEKDTVIGWGKMRIKDAGGSASDYISVLQVKTVITTIDSFFLNSTPFPGILLTSLGLTQGNTTTTYLQNYYRTEEVTPLAAVTFSDATYAIPKSATTHVQRLQTVNAVAEVNALDIKICPNPVMGNRISVDLPSTAKDWRYELINSNGQTVNSGLLSSNGDHALITLPDTIIPGVYTLQINNSNGRYCVKQIEVMR